MKKSPTDKGEIVLIERAEEHGFEIGVRFGQFRVYDEQRLRVRFRPQTREETVRMFRDFAARIEGTEKKPAKEASASHGKKFRAVRCFFGLHDWERHQELMCTSQGGEIRTDVVIAWDQCHGCAKSRLVHILK